MVRITFLSLDFKNTLIWNLVVVIYYTVSDDIDSSAHGSIHEGIFEGVINYEDETYHLEPSHKYFDNPDKHSIIYKFSDTIMDPLWVKGLEL